MRKIAILGALQIGVLLAWAGHHERVRAQAPTFRIPLAPRDPYDVLRGRYFILNPLDRDLNTSQGGAILTGATVETFLRGEKGFYGTALVGFCPAGDVHRVCGLQRVEDGTPRDGFWARSRVMVGDGSNIHRDGRPAADPGWRVNVEMGLDRFFLPDRFQLPGLENDPSWQLEVSYRPGLPLLPKRLWFEGRPVLIGE